MTYQVHSAGETIRIHGPELFELKQIEQEWGKKHGPDIKLEKFNLTVMGICVESNSGILKIFTLLWIKWTAVSLI